MTEPVIVDVLRHGEVAARGLAFRGRTDLPLSEAGWRQMRDVAAMMTATGEGDIARLASSPLRRCRRFAEMWAAEQGIGLEILDDMREMDFGEWDNRDLAELEREQGPALRRFREAPEGFTPPDGECFDAFVARVTACWRRWLADAKGGRHVLVTHGGVIRVLLAHALGAPMHAVWRLPAPYASWSRISVCDGQPPVVRFINRQEACAA